MNHEQYGVIPRQWMDIERELNIFNVGRRTQERGYIREFEKNSRLINTPHALVLIPQSGEYIIAEGGLASHLDLFRMHNEHRMLEGLPMIRDFNGIISGIAFSLKSSPEDIYARLDQGPNVIDQRAIEIIRNMQANGIIVLDPVYNSF